MVPSFGDRVPIRLGDSVEFSLLNGLVEAGVQRVQDIQDGDDTGGCGGRLDNDTPRQSGRNDLHELGRRVGSGHREVGLVDTESVWVRWERNVETDALGVGKEVMKRGWGR
jgi:hypothetical protein